MKKFLVSVVMALVLVALLAIPVMAAPGNGNVIPAVNNPDNLYLFPKDTSTWELILDGAWGKYNYELVGTVISGVFNGHDLTPNTEYTLLTWDEVGGPQVIIGTGTTDGSGNVHIMGTCDIGAPVYHGGDYSDVGYKIWLVPSAYCPGGVINWSHMSTFLWEYKLIGVQ